MNISIIITNYNYGQYLEECILSCIGQTLKPYHIFIVDDCSTDMSSLIYQKYCDKEVITIIGRDKNKGVSSARNKGVEYARYLYPEVSHVIFLDADDILPENYLYEVSKMNADIVYTNYRTFGLRSYFAVCNEDHMHVSSLIDIKVFKDVKFKDVPCEDKEFYKDCKEKGYTFERCISTKLLYRKHDLYNQKNNTDKR